MGITLKNSSKEKKKNTEMMKNTEDHLEEITKLKNSSKEKKKKIMKMKNTEDHLEEIITLKNSSKEKKKNQEIKLKLNMNVNVMKKMKNHKADHSYKTVNKK